MDEEGGDGKQGSVKDNSRFDLKWGSPQEGCFGRVEHDFGFGRVGFQADNRQPIGNGRPNLRRKVSMSGRNLPMAYRF